MKKIFAIIISLCILCASPIAVFAQENETQTNYNKVETAYENKKALQSEAYIDIIDEELIEKESEINETYSLISDLISTNSSLSEIYAGAYMNNDKLVVLLTESQAYFTAILNENNISTQNVSFELVDYSYSYGYDEDYVNENPEKIIYVDYYYIETKTLQTLLYGFTITSFTTEGNGGK